MDTSNFKTRQNINMRYWSFKQCVIDENKKDAFSVRVVWGLGWSSARDRIYLLSIIKEFLLLK